MDKGYIELLKIMKQVNKKDNPIKLGTMKSSNSVDIGDLPLDKDDLYINDRLTDLEKGDTVLVLKIDEEKYVIAERVKEL